MPSKKTIPSFDLYKILDTPINFELTRLEESYSVYDSSSAHRHNYYEVIYFEKSGGIHEIDFKIYKVEENTFHFVSPEQVHRLKRDKSVTGYVISFTGDFFLNHTTPRFIDSLPFFNYSENSPTVRLNEPKAREDILELILKIQKEQNNKHEDKLEMISSVLVQLLLSVKRIHLSVNKESRDNSHSTLTLNFKKLVEEKYRECKVLAEYAAMLNITSGHLNDMIQKDAGLSASEVLYNRIILEAKRLLYHSPLSIKEIAGLLNYEDPSHFSRFFKNHSGVTPEQFRKQSRELYH